MAWISGLEKKQAPRHPRWFYRVMRKMLGQDLMPVKLHLLMFFCGVAPYNMRSLLTAFPIHQS